MLDIKVSGEDFSLISSGRKTAILIGGGTERQGVVCGDFVRICANNRQCNAKVFYRKKYYTAKHLVKSEKLQNIFPNIKPWISRSILERYFNKFGGVVVLKILV